MSKKEKIIEEGPSIQNAQKHTLAEPCYSVSEITPWPDFSEEDIKELKSPSLLEQEINLKLTLP